MKCLTFNHHESFLASLTEVGYSFDVVDRYGSLDLKWNTSSSKVPSNVNLVPFDKQIKQRLSSGYYDIVICHTVKNLVWMLPYFNQKFIFIAHIPLFSHNFSSSVKSWVKKIVYQAFCIGRKSSFVAVSKFKGDSWGIRNRKVIPLTPRSRDMQQVSYATPKVITVGNLVFYRKEELGWPDLDLVMQKFNVTILGNNCSKDIPSAIKPKDRKDFCQKFREHNIYLYTIKQPFGDGYNTAMLEAMSIGMAVVTIENPSSPIIHGHNGLVAKDGPELIEHIKFLQENPSERAKMGLNGKKTIEKIFSRSKFICSWRETMEDLTNENTFINKPVTPSEIR